MLRKLVVLTAALGALACATTSADPSPASTNAPPVRFEPQPNFEYWALIPTRQPGSRELNVAVGIFQSYRLVRSPLVEMILSIRDPRSLTIQDYLLSATTTLDGKALRCVRSEVLGGQRFCNASPEGLVPGKTRLAVLYWTAPLATDSIVTFPDDK
jgi:hypothetical protein